MKTLLLNQSHEVISFINFRSVIKLILKNKVEILAEWERVYNFGLGTLKHPAIARLNYYVKIPPPRAKFSRKNIFKRDKYRCQYCNKKISYTEATLDHIIPTSRGGSHTWLNCTTSCINCNYLKGNKTLEQAGMRLLKEPYVPSAPIFNEYLFLRPKHPEWAFYFENY